MPCVQRELLSSSVPAVPRVLLPALLGQTCRSGFASGFTSCHPDEQSFAFCNQVVTCCNQVGVHPAGTTLCATTAYFCKTHYFPMLQMDHF